MRALSPEDLDAIPRLGWVREPSPITSLPRTAASIGIDHLCIKRDDLLAPIHGGSKPRKLDYVLAAPELADAPVWASSGGIGSGSLVALTSAAAERGRKLRAHVFWTPISEGVLDNLAFTASGPTEIISHRSRTTMALTSPAILLSASDHGAAVIPPGATSALGMMGTVRAGLELAQQIREGAIPEPDRVYVALGSGGTAVGLAVGLALGGARAEVMAVSVVERMLSPIARLRSLEREALAELTRWKIPLPEGRVPLTVVRGHVGRAYAHTTAESLAACEIIAAEGVHLEPIYTGKAMAALLDDARRTRPKSVLFWCTVRRSLPAPDPAWRDRLPPLFRRLVADPNALRIERRRVLAGLAAAAAIGVAVRTTGYGSFPGFPGEVLSTWHARVLVAAAEVLLADATPAQIEAIPARVDRYLTGMPPKVKREAKAMLALIEQGSTPLGRRWHRFTRLAPADRLAYLEGLEARGGLLAQAYCGLRDLVMLGFYQQPSTWSAIGYGGPLVSAPADPSPRRRAPWPAYDALVAPPGASPRSVIS